REAILFFFLGAHWRKPVDLSDETIEQARAQAQSFRDAFLEWNGTPAGLPAGLVEVLEDDFNTPAALALMHGWKDAGQLDLVAPGLGALGPAALIGRRAAPPAVVALAERRSLARERRDFAESDRLRDEIAVLGWEVRDVVDGYLLVPRP